MADYHHETYFDGTQVAVCWTLADTTLSILFFVGSISVFFFLPLVILIVLYSMIAMNLMVNPGVVGAPHMRQENSSSAQRYRKQVILMLGTVVIFFFICLLPFRALTLWIIIVPDEDVRSLGIDGYYNLLYFCRLMFYLNSAINPILYNLMSSKFRNGFLKLCGIRKNCFYKQKRIFLRHGTYTTSSMTANSSINRSTSTTSRSKTRSSDRSKTDSYCSTYNRHKDKNCSIILNDIALTKDKYSPNSFNYSEKLVPDYKRRNSSDELVLLENCKSNELNRKYSYDNIVYLNQNSNNLLIKNTNLVDISRTNNISTNCGVSSDLKTTSADKKNCKFIIETQSIKKFIKFNDNNDNNEQKNDNFKIIPNIFNVHRRKKSLNLKESFV